MTVACPACGFDNEDSVTECARCHLSAGLFDAVREAVGDPNADPQYVRVVGEILSAVDEEAATEETAADSSGRLIHPGRFPATPAPRSGPSFAAAVRSLDTLPSLPALPPGAGVELFRRQVDEYLLLGRRQGIDLTDFIERAKQGVLSQDRESLEVLSRELFIHLAASLSEEYEVLLAKRNEVAQLVPTRSADLELEGCRSVLAAGDIAGAQRRLKHVDELLTELEDHWATVQILATEADLLAETIRELGGDPSPALGPLEEGRRRAREGQREAAEPILARAALALWSILNPLFTNDLSRLKELVLKHRADGGDVTPPIHEMRDLATNLRHRNFAAAIGAYRRLRDSVEAFAPVAAPPPAADAAVGDAGAPPPG